MWIKWSSRIIGLFAILVFLLLLSADAIHVAHEINPPNATEHCHGPAYSPLERAFGQTIASADAYWTAIASLIGIVALALICEQLYATQAANNVADRAAKAAEKAAKQTKRSVKAYIEAERGILFHYKIGKDPDEWAMEFCFKNIGNGSLIVTHMAQHFAMVHVDTTIKPQLQRAAKVHVPVEARGFFSSFDDPEGEFKKSGGNLSIPILPMERENFNLPDYRPVVQMLVRYTTLGGAFDNRITLIGNHFTGKYSIRHTEELTYENAVTVHMDFPRTFDRPASQ